MLLLPETVEWSSPLCAAWWLPLTLPLSFAGSRRDSWKTCRSSDSWLLPVSTPQTQSGMGRKDWSWSTVGLSLILHRHCCLTCPMERVSLGMAIRLGPSPFQTCLRAAMALSLHSNEDFSSLMRPSTVNSAWAAALWTKKNYFGPLKCGNPCIQATSKKSQNRLYHNINSIQVFHPSNEATSLIRTLWLVPKGDRIRDLKFQSGNFTG